MFDLRDGASTSRWRLAHSLPGSPSSVAIGSEKTDHSVQMLRKHYWEVVDRETAERYWDIGP